MAIDAIATGVAGIASGVIGIAAIAVTISAKRRLSNPQLLGYVRHLLWVMVSITLFSIWHATRELLSLKEIYGPVVEIPEYGLVIVTCILLLSGAWSILKMSREYGFRERGGKGAVPSDKGKAKSKGEG